VLLAAVTGLVPMMPLNLVLVGPETSKPGKPVESNCPTLATLASAAAALYFVRSAMSVAHFAAPMLPAFLKFFGENLEIGVAALLTPVSTIVDSRWCRWEVSGPQVSTIDAEACRLAPGAIPSSNTRALTPYAPQHYCVLTA
jgi:hypothetical protein